MNKALISFLSICFWPAAAQDLPSGESILQRYVDVTGGKAAYDKIHNEVAKGTMELTGKNVRGMIVSFEAGPNKNYSAVDIEGVGKVESGTDGTVAWENSAIAGPRIKTDVERDEMIRASVFNAHLSWQTLYQKVETTGSETIDGDECYRVVLTPKSGRPETEYYTVRNRSSGENLKCEHDPDGRSCHGRVRQRLQRRVRSQNGLHACESRGRPGDPGSSRYDRGERRDPQGPV